MIKFGPAGNSLSFYAEGHKHTEEMPEWLRGRGLDCFEYSLGRGITVKEETAAVIGEKARLFGIEMSVHAPYYVNFASADSYEKSERYILESLKILRVFGGSRLVFHPGSPLKQTREKAFGVLKDAMKKLAETVKSRSEFAGLTLCPETMGKAGQMGSVPEILEICKIDAVYTPCIDFGHVNARERGSLKTEDDYGAVLDAYLDALYERALNMHVHFSRIQYAENGEIRHLTFDDREYGPYFETLAPVLAEKGMRPYIICESDGTQAEDAAEMKRIYENTLKNRIKSQ
ncbi:MAG: TIM barrel protein [Clostridiales bacterium]|jgi:deoxyribonuclease-4|nr:TIM barrel protein [Clostridiales bacterium]